ncbi:MAG: hypothetical protein GXO09_05240 [Crenarchaeota archaeon]|nr:hypothetical protein [Thermoproteota archaeon]
MGGLGEALEEERLLLEAIGRGEYCCLRHGLPYVRVSMMVGQLLCERRLDYELSEGRIEVHVRELMRLLRPLLASARSLAGCSGGRLVVSMPVAALIDRVPVVGRPDAILFEDCRVAAIVRLKEAERASRLDEARLRLYGLLVDYSPLPHAEPLRLIEVCSVDRRVLAEALLALRGGGIEGLKAVEGCRVYSWIYDRGSALQLFSRLAGYWLGLRAPMPRPGRLCMECRWRGVCSAGGL